MAKRKLILCVVLFSILFLIRCASDLPYVKSKHSIQSIGKLEPEKVSFLDIDSNETFTLLDYFKNTPEKSYFLLFFESRGCTSCGEKMKEFRDTILGKHPVFATDKGKRLEIIAISVDPVESRDLVLGYKEQNGYFFLRWLDNRAEMLKQWFLPTTMDTFGVPVAVFTTKTDILWNVDNKEHYTAADLMDKIVKTLDVEPDETPTPTPTLSPTPTPTSPPTIPDDLKFSLYQGQETQLIDLLKPSKYTVISVFGELCTGCWDEMVEWSKSGSLRDYCRNDEKCRIFVMENGVPEEEFMADRYIRMRDRLDEKSITFPLLLDPQPSDNSGYLKRYFDGYLTSKFPSWGGMYGTVIYQDEKIIKDFKAGSPDEVTNYIKELQ